MDYLPCVYRAPAHEPLDVPFACTPTFTYDGLGFAAYPQRNGIEQDAIEAATHIWNSVDEFNAFVQSWLFFGLLFDVTATVSDQVKQDDFITLTDSGRRIVNMIQLPDILKAWARRTNGLHPIAKRAELGRVTTYLRTAGAMLQRTLQHSLLSAGEPGNSRSLYVICLSIQALGETLWEQRTQLLEGRNDTDADIDAEFPPFCFRNKFVESLLRDAGWWSAEIARFPHNIRFQYYLSFFRVHDLALGRDEEAELRSVNPRTELSGFKPAHVYAECYCGIFSSRIPTHPRTCDEFLLISTSSPDGISSLLSLRTLPASLKDPTPFVAFSHLRASGLGNDKSNSLPKCQVLRLQALANELYPNSRASVPFWVDTLCVPVKGPGKHFELQKAQRIFQQADKVLVLDKSLMCVASGRRQENLVRIRSSLWTKRLWTVQEGAVARDLIFAFRNVNKRLSDLMHEYEDSSADEYDAELPLLRDQCLRDRSIPVMSAEDDERLLQTLMQLSDDIKLAEYIVNERNCVEATFTDADTNGATNANFRERLNNLPLSHFLTYYHPHRLRQILRLGLLARRHLFYFPQSDEAAQFRIVVPGILAQYTALLDSLPAMDAVVHFNEGLSIKTDSKLYDQSYFLGLFERLKRIQDIPVSV